MDDAAAALLRACVAHADGDDDAAALAFDAAIGGFARLTLVTGVVEAIELWASAVGGSRGAGMLEVAASLDRGELDVRAAHDLVRAIALGDGDLAEPP